VRASLALHGPAGAAPAGQPVPIRAELRNEGADELWIVGVLDGSETGTRYPHWLPSVRLDGRLIAAPPAAEDPLVGPLRASDVRQVAPGKAFDPGRLATFGLFAPPLPGAYLYSLELSTESPNADAWLGTFNQDRSVLPLIERIPRLSLRADLTIRVK
jgi:hypothetical protein